MKEHPLKWLSVNETAKELGLGRSAIYALVSSGQLACYRIGPSEGRIRFKPEDIDAYVESKRRGPKVRRPPAPQYPRPKRDHGF